ncbi:hypothetical protein SNEBB_003605 [Seison nebaliae]|nr:hypothetical protein SNEBB_003605 [Seison nebaliae]
MGEPNEMTDSKNNSSFLNLSKYPLHSNVYGVFMENHLTFYGYNNRKNNYSANKVANRLYLKDILHRPINDENSDGEYIYGNNNRTRQLVSRVENGKIKTKLRPPQDLYDDRFSGNRYTQPRWPKEIKLIPEYYQPHFSIDVLKVDSKKEIQRSCHYQKSGREQLPKVRNPTYGGFYKIVYDNERITDGHFEKSCERSQITTTSIENINETDNSSSNDGIIFESRFESGNLMRAIQLENDCYELYMQYDLYTEKHTQWFYFRFENANPEKTYRFSIHNFCKSSSLYGEAMKPLFYSKKMSELKKIGWYRNGDSVVYYRNNTSRIDDPNKYYYSLSWKFRVPYDDDVCYFAHCYPYTYTDLELYIDDKWQKHRVKPNLEYSSINLFTDHRLSYTPLEIRESPVLPKIAETVKSEKETNEISRKEDFSKEKEEEEEEEESPDGEKPSKIPIEQPVSTTDNILQRRILCKTVAGNHVWLLTITSPSRSGMEHQNKKFVVLTARVHPGESVSSWMMKGIIDFLLSDNDQAEMLRRKFIFKIIPMLNPDGVIIGNYRCSLSGRDLNRNYRTDFREQFPTIYSTRQLIRDLKQQKDILLYCDLHGHSKKMNIFVYGCESTYHPSRLYLSRIFPFMLHKNAPDKFSYSYSRFMMQKSKEGTGRIVMFNMGITNSFTMEASFCGSRIGNLAGYHFNSQDYEQMGKDFCHTISDFTKDDRVYFNKALHIIQLKLNGKTFKNFINVDTNVKVLINDNDLMEDDDDNLSEDDSEDSCGSDSSEDDGLPLQYTQRYLKQLKTNTTTKKIKTAKRVKYKVQARYQSKPQKQKKRKKSKEISQKNINEEFSVTKENKQKSPVKRLCRSAAVTLRKSGEKKENRSVITLPTVTEKNHVEMMGKIDEKDKNLLELERIRRETILRGIDKELAQLNLRKKKTPIEQILYEWPDNENRGNILNYLNNNNNNNNFNCGTFASLGLACPTNSPINQQRSTEKVKEEETDNFKLNSNYTSSLMKITRSKLQKTQNNPPKNYHQKKQHSEQQFRYINQVSSENESNDDRHSNSDYQERKKSNETDEIHDLIIRATPLNPKEKKKKQKIPTSLSDDCLLSHELKMMEVQSTLINNHIKENRRTKSRRN